MKHATTTKIALLAAVILLTSQLHAQVEDESKITIEITKEINGEKKTFKGEYENEEQMRNDPNYKEWIGEGDDFHFKGFGAGDFDMDIQSFMDQSGFSFQFDTGSGLRSMMFIDSMMDANEEEMEKMVEQIHKNMKAFELDDENGFHFFFSDSADQHFGPQFFAFGGPKHLDITVTKKLEITEVEGDEFGKKGMVKESESLSLEELDYYPNPSNGKFKLRFKVPNQGELGVNIYDLEGKEVFTRYFNQFGGTFSETIDLGNQPSGIYLLEIHFDKKRLTRKIVID